LRKGDRIQIDAIFEGQQVMSVEATMPESKSPRKGQITVKVSAELISIAEELAQLQGDSVAEVYRSALKKGLSALVEEDAKFRVHKKVVKGLAAIDLDDTAKSVGLSNGTELVEAIARGEIKVSR
jgi:hypothetical protein